MAEELLLLAYRPRGTPSVNLEMLDYTLSAAVLAELIIRTASPWRTGTYAYEPRSPPATPSWTRPSNGWRRTPARHRPSVTGGSPCTHPNAAPACRPDARTSAFVSLAHACRVLPAFLSAEERRRAKEITAQDPVGALVSQSFAQAARESIGRLAGGAST